MQNLTTFWKKESKSIFWFKKPKKILFKKKFFTDGKCNIAFNCLKKNILENKGDKIGIVTIDENCNALQFSYKELENLVDNFITFLRSNFKDKDLRKNIISIHSSANIISAISMLACTKIGITHCVLFEDLSREAISTRLKLLKSKILITNTSEVNYKNTIEGQKNVKIIRFCQNEYKSKKIININKNYFLKSKFKKIKDIKYKKLNSNHPSFILFTSGTTGQPKGIVHSTGGYLLYAKYTCQKQFGLNSKKIILTASDAGWINGHTYALYGPLSLGSKTILLNKPISLLNSKILKHILLKEKIDILYLPVTLIRMLKRFSNKLKIKSKYLQTLGSMGEPLSENVGQWFSKKFTFNRKQIINTYFQTETGGILCSRNYREKTKNILFSSVGKPINKLLGIFIDKSLEAKNEIKVSNLWPGCMINVINGKKFFNKYWDKKNNFRLFDKASIIKKNIMIHGRLDDVMNIRGHRIGSAEIENILLKLDEVYEAAAVSIYDKNQAEKLILFIVGKEISNKINIILNKYFGSYSLPEEIFFVNELPKTRSGKILRRLLKDIYENPSLNNYGDLSTIMNRKIVQIIKNKVISRAKI